MAPHPITTSGVASGSTILLRTGNVVPFKYRSQKIFLVRRAAIPSETLTSLDFKRSKPTVAKINGSARAKMCDQIFVPVREAIQSNRLRGHEVARERSRPWKMTSKRKKKGEQSD
jgi:hypothetical protein